MANIDYSSLIVSQHQKPKFTALVKLLTDAISSNTALINSFPSLFDIDDAVGHQLDAVGKWIGLTRVLAPSIDNVYFALDDSTLGFDVGYWKDLYAAGGTTVLPDSEYRSILRAKIALNRYDGDLPDAIAAIQTALPNNGVIIQDNQDMSMVLGITGVVTPLTQALITRGYYNVRPAGVQLFTQTTTVFFGFDMNTTSVRGFGAGSWGSTVVPR